VSSQYNCVLLHHIKIFQFIVILRSVVKWGRLNVESVTSYFIIIVSKEKTHKNSKKRHKIQKNQKKKYFDIFVDVLTAHNVMLPSGNTISCLREPTSFFERFILGYNSFFLFLCLFKPSHKTKEMQKKIIRCMSIHTHKKSPD
jgi:hypothetical protein